MTGSHERPDRPPCEDATLPPREPPVEEPGPARSEAETLPPAVVPQAAPPGPPGETATLPPRTAFHPRPAETGTLPHIEPPPRFPSRFPEVPGYEIEGELGRGGMGVVYKARQLRADRVVALKMILAGAAAGEAELARFRTEAQAVARLQHRNVVQVFEVGEYNGLPYFSLEFCPRGTLDRRIRGVPQPPEKAARILQALTRGVLAAHKRKIIHRDLKPQNVLIGADGVLKITDFGLAKKLDAGEGRTRTGVVMGTPEYMAPEQAGGEIDRMGPATDIWALGAILYQLLTGRPPFKAATSLDTILQVIGDEPVRPRVLVRNIPRDLETICLKCLQKRPGDRYSSAADLLADLTAFRKGDPIKARPIRGWRKLLRWCRRNPSLAMTIAVGVIGPVGALAFTNYLRYDIPSFDEFRAAMKASNSVTGTATAPPVERVQSPRFTRGWTAGEPNAGPVCGVALRDNGSQVALAHEDGTLGLLDGKTGKPLRRLTGHGDTVYALAYQPGGRQLASAGADRSVIIWDTETGQRVHKLEGHTHSVRDVAYHPDGTILASAGHDHTIKLWNAETGEPFKDLIGHERGVRCLAFSSDGSRLVSGDDAGAIAVWQVDGTKPRRNWKAHAGRVTDVCFTPDGNGIVSAGWDRKLQRWDLTADGKPQPRTIALTRSVAHGLFSHPSGWLVVVSQDGSVLLWAANSADGNDAPRDPSSGTAWGGVANLDSSPSREPLTCIAGNRDGSRLVIGGWREAVQCWDLVKPVTPPGKTPPTTPKGKP